MSSGLKIECTQVSFESDSMYNCDIKSKYENRLEIRWGTRDWTIFSDVLESFKKYLENKEEVVDLLSEHMEIEFQIKPELDEEITFKIDGVEIRSERKGQWKYDPRHVVGYREIQINNESLGYLPIFPKFGIKMYEKMIEDLRAKLIDIYPLENKGSSFISDASFPNILERFKRIGYFFDELKKIMNGIRLNPHRSLVGMSCYSELYELESCGDDIVVPLVTANRFIRNSKGEIPVISNYFGKDTIPERILNRKKEITFDVYENRMLKHFLIILNQHLSNFELFIQEKINIYSSEKDGSNSEIENRQIENRSAKYEEIRKSCSIYRKVVRNFLQMPFLENVGDFEGFKGSTPILEKESNYSKFYELYLEYKKNFKQEFELHDCVFLGLEDTPKLYEYWCLLKIMDLLNIEYDLLNFVDKRFGQFGMIKIPEDKALYQNERYQIIYHKNYQEKKIGDMGIGSYSGNKKPDIVIEIFEGKEIKEIVILDPKYRISIGAGKNPEENIDADSINKMHVYKDSIISKNESLEMNRLVKKAVIVHPIDKNQEKSFGTDDDFIKTIYLSPIENTDSKETLEIKNQVGKIIHFQTKAIELYKAGEVSLSRAAEIAGINIEDFKQILSNKGIRREIKPEKDIDKKVKAIIKGY
ncbi:MAG: DUF2357 domain-containing protein [Candidatus Methanoperedens sp.]